jgi:glycosyltransferase involved in cell wall biosynthesis
VTAHRVTVVVASQNRRDELLASLPRHEGPVILVDNGSTDGSPEAVRRHHPHVDVVALETNHGAPARTIGVQRASTPYVAFADDDSWWEPGALARAADLFDKHTRMGLLGGRVLVGPDERLDPVSAAMRDSPLGLDDDLPGPSVLGFLACGTIVRREASARCCSSSARRSCWPSTWLPPVGGSPTPTRWSPITIRAASGSALCAGSWPGATACSPQCCDDPGRWWREP